MATSDLVKAATIIKYYLVLYNTFLKNEEFIHKIFEGVLLGRLFPCFLL